MTIYAVVENDIVTEVHYSLPINWRNTSGFYHIGDDPEVLRTFGWYIVEITTPEYNPETQTLGDIELPVYNSAEDKVTAKYHVVEIQKEPAVELQRRFMILVRGTRDYLISQSDWTMLSDVVKIKSPEWVTSWEAYRQSLRDYPDQFVFNEQDLPPDFNTLVWPSKPES